jgi:uncharacterized sporulation protein YeaH/YhbH (DUF444 family)
MEASMKDPTEPKPRTTRGTKLITPRPARLITAAEIWPPVTEAELNFCEVPPVPRGIYRVPGDSAWFRGTKDAHRFYERSRREIDAAGSILNNRHFNTGGNTVMVTGSTQWQFIFGRDQKGGGGGKGGPGGGDSENSNDGVEVEVDIKEHPVFKDLELPNLERKKTARTEVVGVRLAGLDKTGTRSDWARKDSLKQYIKRVSGAVSADPSLAPAEDSDYLVPTEMFLTRRDNRFWTYDETRQPIIEATAYLLTDKSGSITQHMFDMIYLFDWCAVTFLRMNYPGIKIVILGHTHQEPIEFPDWEAMVTDKTTGGTVISPSLRWIRDHARQNNPANKVNCYLIQGGDGDNTASDNEPSRQAYLDLLADGFNHIVWEETGKADQQFPPGFARRESDHTILMRQLAAAHPRMFHVGKIVDRESVFKEFRLAYKRRGGKVV